MRKQGRDAGNGRFLSVEEAKARGDRATVETVPSLVVSEAMIAAGRSVMREFEARPEPALDDEDREFLSAVYAAMWKARDR